MISACCRTESGRLVPGVDFAFQCPEDAFSFSMCHVIHSGLSHLLLISPWQVKVVELSTTSPSHDMAYHKMR